MSSTKGANAKKLTYGMLKKKVDVISLLPDEEPIQDEEVWAVINSFVEQNGLNSAQIHSYNDFIHNGIQSVFDIPNIKHTRIEYNGKTYDMDMGEHYILSPKYTELNGESHVLYPMEALWRNTTYAAELYADITITPPSGEPTLYEKLYLGNLPVQVLSDLCNLSLIKDDREELARHSEDFFDHGGYFVIASKGDSSSGGTAQRRVLVSQERIANNQVFIFKNRKQAPKFSIYTECHSTLTGSHMTTTTVGKIQNRISCILPWIDGVEIPVGVLFRAFGVEDEKTMAMLILGPKAVNDDKESLNILIPVLEYSYECNTREAALHFIGRRGRKFMKENDVVVTEEETDLESEGLQEDLDDEDMLPKLPDETGKSGESKQTKDRDSAISYAKHLLSIEVFSHLGQGEEHSHDKAMFLGYMIKKLLWVILGRGKPENRDHHMNKRINTTGVLLRQQFHGAMRRLIMEVTNSTLKALRQGHNVNITSWIKPSIITNAMQGAISNNTWNTGGGKSKGISQIYEQYNYAAGIANMRKVVLPIDGEGGKITEPRDLQGCHFGIMCPSETPEGKKVGLVRNLALLCYITIGTDPKPVARAINNVIGTDHIDNYPASLDWARIFLNGTPVGAAKDPKNFIRAMIKLRRSADLSPETSIAYHDHSNEIHVSTEAGRPCRPLLVVEDGEITLKLNTIESLLLHELTWSQLMAGGWVELIDKAEEESALVIGYPSEVPDLPDEFKMKVTHCELHPSMIYGIGGSIIAFPNHNQSPRNCYQCIWEEEPVLMADGTWKKIRNVRIGDKVITFDPQTMQSSATNVIYTKTTTTTKKMVKITTVTGREITVTEDHKIMTSLGWMEAKDITPSTKVGIFLHPSSESFVPEIQIHETIIMDSASFEKICTGYGIKETLIKSHIKTLEEKHLLPLYSDDDRLYILARFMGFALTDGSIGIYNGSPRYQADFGRQSSGQEFEDDMGILGFSKCKLTYHENPYRGSIMRTWKTTHETACVSLLITLGYIPGKKTTNPAPRVPKWIMEGSMLVKREFLAAYQGGDGCQIRWNKTNTGHNYVCGETLLTKRDEHINSLIDASKDMIVLFSEFDVIATLVNTRDVKYPGSKTSGYRIKCSEENLINYYQKIGYRYDHHKTAESGLVVEYLLYKKHIRAEHILSIENVREQLLSLSIPDTVKLTGYSYSEVSGIKRSMNNGRKIMLSPLKAHQHPDPWISTLGYMEQSIFVPVMSVEEMPNVKISDITTESPNHSFIAGMGFCVHNSSMGKQAVGIPFTNYKQMMTGSFQTMRYLQAPIALSRAATIIGFDEMPAGQNAMILNMPRVFNEEDSLEINEDSTHRGFMITDKWVCYRAERRKEKGEIFGVPTIELCERFRGNPGKLNESGFVPKGVRVEDGDILIGKMVEVKYNANDTGSGVVKKKYISLGVRYEHPWPAVVDAIQLGRTGDGYEYISVMTVQERIPIVGDKLAARHGQKGIIGKLVRAIDLPFNQQGMPPDVVFNSLAYPSRMTLAMIIEVWAGKAVMSTSPLHDVLMVDMVANENDDLDDWVDPDEAYDGVMSTEFSEMFSHPKHKHLVDATPFRKFDRNVIRDEMARYGMSLGDEYWTDGITGKPTRCFAFYGPCYLQRLKHQVVDKVHARARGPRTTLTRQPKEGRNAGGGLRIGTMERDCMLGQGASRFVRDRLMEQSDEFRTWMCNICGLPAHVEQEGRIRECRVCSTTDVSKIRIPYGTKLIVQELMAENIVPRILTVPHWQISDAENLEDK